MIEFAKLRYYKNLHIKILTTRKSKYVLLLYVRLSIKYDIN